MLNLSTHQLHVFLTAAEALNFTQAAQRLQMTQPSVSQHIQALEEHFGVPLFARTGRSMELTDAGQALIPLARELVYLSVHIEETMASLKGDVQGHLVVACSTASGRYLLPKFLAQFHREYPQVRATCKVYSQGQALQMLHDGVIHLAIASNPPYFPEIEYMPVVSEKVVIIVPLDHPWALKGVIELEELRNEPLVMPDETNEIFQAVHDALSDTGLSIYELKPAISLGNLEAVVLAVQEGLGVGFAPQIIVNRLVGDGVAQVAVEGLQINRTLFLGRNTHRPATGAQKAFWDMLAAVPPAALEDIKGHPTKEKGTF